MAGAAIRAFTEAVRSGSITTARRASDYPPALQEKEAQAQDATKLRKSPERVNRKTQEERLRHSARTKFSGAELRAYRAESWIRRGEQINHNSLETERERRGALDDRFIAYWIALNALYGQARYRGRDVSERTDLRTFLQFIQRTCVSGQVQSALRESDARLPLDRLLGDAFLDNDNWKHWDAEGIVDADERLSSRVVGKDREPDLLELFSRLYVLRTQLFHGCAARGSSSKGKTMEYAVTLLRKLLPLFVTAMRQQGEAQTFLARPPYPPSEPAQLTPTASARFNPISIRSRQRKK